MTLEELTIRVHAISNGHGSVVVTLDRGKYYSRGTCNNTLAYDRLSCDIPDSAVRFGYTAKQAYEALLSCVVMDKKYPYPWNR